MKAKAALIVNHQRGTGGGSPINLKFTSLETRCFEMMTKEAVVGDDELPEGGARKIQTKKKVQLVTKVWPKLEQSAKQAPNELGLADAEIIYMDGITHKEV